MCALELRETLENTQMTWPARALVALILLIVRPATSLRPHSPAQTSATRAQAARALEEARPARGAEKAAEILALSAFSVLLYGVGAASESVVAVDHLQPVVDLAAADPPSLFSLAVPSASAAELVVDDGGRTFLQTITAQYDTALHEHALPTKAATSFGIFGVAEPLDVWMALRLFFRWALFWGS